MSSKIIYVFDFDGVICNSINECMLTSYNAFYRAELTNIDDVPNQFKVYFYKNRHYVRPAKEYYLVCKGYRQQKELSSSVFDEMKSNYSEKMDDFEKVFYLKRKFLKNKPDIWLAYHVLYKHVAQFISEFSHKFFILTTKDRDSVEMLANHFEFINKIENIFSKEISTNKAVLFTHLFNKYHYLTNQNKVIYVDDNEFHLSEVKHFPLKLYFAKWGYAGSQKFNNFMEINSLKELI